MLGKVKWFSNQKGYGFITSSEGKDVFVHYSAIISEGYKSLKENQEVDFEVTQGEKGDQAADVKMIEPAKTETAEEVVTEEK